MYDEIDIKEEEKAMIKKITEELKQLDKYLSNSDERIYGKTIFDGENTGNLKINPQSIYMQDILPLTTFRMSDKEIERIVMSFTYELRMKRLIFNSAEKKQKKDELRQYIKENKMHSMHPMFAGIPGDICNKQECDKLTKYINDVENMGIINQDDINDMCIDYMKEIYQSQCRSRRLRIGISFENPIVMKDYKQQNDIHALGLIRAGSMQYESEFEKLAPIMLEEEEEEVFFNGDWNEYNHLFAILKLSMKKLGIELDEEEIKKRFLEKRELNRQKQLSKENAVELELRHDTSIEIMVELLRTYKMVGKTAVCRFNDKEIFSSDNLDMYNVYKKIYGKDEEENNKLSMKTVVSNAVVNEAVLTEVDKIDNIGNYTKEGKEEREGDNIHDN